MSDLTGKSVSEKKSQKMFFPDGFPGKQLQF
jgi:hypothetical protein